MKFNDIALIGIKQKITTIKPIGLPTDKAQTYAGKTATTISWGLTSVCKGKTENHAQILSTNFMYVLSLL